MTPRMGLPPSRLAVLDLVRRGDRTVNTLAERLRISDNAVRVHLIALERDGLLRRAGIVRSGTVGQPAAEYDLTPAGEEALSAAYPAALTAVVTAISDRMDVRAQRSLYLDAGKRLAESMPGRAAGSLAERAEACAALINKLGGSATTVTGRGSATVVGAGCPLANSVRRGPGICYLIEGLLEEHAGVKAEQQCVHGERPSCRFRLTSA